MKELILDLEKLLKVSQVRLLEFSDTRLTAKRSPTEWSRKEMLGHLIETGIYELQRINGIQFFSEPAYSLSPSQNKSEKMSQYNSLPTLKLVQVWDSINRKIIKAVLAMPDEMFHQLIYVDEEKASLHFLMENYVDYLEQYMQQILYNRFYPLHR